MLKKFIKKHKENFLLFTGALTAGVLSFFVTLNVYPEIKENQLNEELITMQTNTFSSFDNEDFEDIGKEVENKVLVDIKKEDYDIEPETEEIKEVFALKKAKSFDWPLSGDIIKEFAVESLVYSKTLNEWCTHEGVDIAGKVGDVVVAMEDGIVEQIFEDEKYGKTIIVSHENGYKSYYSFVAPENLAIEKQKVRKGEAIGRLTTSVNFESMDETHLHFAIKKNDIYVSPIVEIDEIK